MKASVAFIFFMLFLAGIAFVNLRGMQENAVTAVESLDQLTHSAWRPDRLGEMRLDDATDMYVQFESDGQLGGHAGCNRFFGSYDFVDGTIEIGPLGATRMACPEPAMSFEISFLDALQSAKTLTAANNRLEFRNDQGDMVLRTVSIERRPSN